MYKSIRSVSARHKRRLKQKILNVSLNQTNRGDHVNPSEMVSIGQQKTEVSPCCSTQEATSALPVKPNFNNDNHNIFEFDQDFDLEDILSETSSEVSTGSRDILCDNYFKLKDEGNGSYLTFDLKDWALECKLSQAHLTKLLGILRRHNIKVPQDARTLMNTQRDVNTISVSPGHYSHLGIKTQILKLLQILPNDFQIPSCIKIVINVDGLPLSKSSGSQFWPIIAWFANSNFEGIFKTKTFIIGVYHGYTKPKSPNEFLNKFCEEMRELQENGFLFRNKTLHVNISHIVCDAPARAYITCTKNHTGYHGCSKCIQEGEFRLNRMTFPELNSTCRTDDSFRIKSDEYHHTGVSLLENLNIGMVTQIPIDYMHLVCLGVTKRLFQFWHKGRQDVRIPTSLFSDLSDIILNFKRYITSDFARKPRTLFEVDRFKATEFRQLLLYTGVVALKDILSDDQYHNFLHLSCAIRILITPDVCIALNECAQNMLYDFVVSFGEIYGKEFITYNVHNLIHLPSDVKNFGCLDNFSAFPAESHMFQIKQKICIQSGKPLQQLIKRLSEQDAKLNKTNNSGNLNMKKDYIEIKCKTFTLSNKQPNNVCLLKNGKFLRITNILKKDGLIYVTDMDYAVVKFTNETTESDSEVVSEVPVSWLTKNNTHCKWPSEKFASVYIAKKFDPKDDWEEFPIEVEYFCETLAEAKAKLKKKDKEETVGRGHRNIKPTDYFSPAEEDERNMKPKKKIDKKNTPDDTYESAVNFLNSFPQKQSSGTISPSSLENGNPLSVTPTGSTEESRSDGAFSIIPEDNLEGNLMTHVVIPESDVKQLVTKVDQVLGMIAGLQIDMAAIKEVIPELTKPPTGGSSDELSKSLPLTDLEELEQYNNELENKEQERKNFMKFLKSVGGHDAKDWTYRLMRSVMTDTLAEACSWTGRKSNYEIRNLKIFDLLYRVVNQKTACTAKDFTNYVAEWLRHAHTRKLRKDNKK